MPLITSCPECQTQFVVTKEQLKAYEGQVRCGTCNHVFNAKAHLIKPVKPKKSPAKKSSVQVVPEAALESASPESMPLEATVSSIEANVAEHAEHIEITVPDHLKDIAQEETTAITSNEDIVQLAIATPSMVQDLSIDDKFNKRQKGKFSWGLLLLSLLLLLGLLAQLTYFMRTEISANYPQTKPLLALACAQIGCDVPLPKKIDLLTIDDSDMQEHVEYEQVLQFTSTLINHANVPQAYPNIELTLTDTDDEPVLKRTFSAKEYLHNNANVENGIAAKEEVRIKLNMNTSDVAVAGYRVTLAY